MQNKSLDDFFSLNNIKKLKNKLVDKKLNNLISNIIIKLFKKNEIIKEKVISEFNDEYEKIDKQKQKEIQAKRISFDNVDVGDIILAATPNYNRKDLSHYYRPFLVVGKKDDRLYALYSTSNVKYKNNDKYYQIYNSFDDKKYSYIDCSNINVISFDMFNRSILKYNRNGINEQTMIKILDKMMLYGNFFNYIDYKTFNFKPEKGSIVKSGDNFYLVTKIYENDNYYLANLLVERNDEDNYINLFKKQYVLDKEKYELPFNKIDCMITKISLNNYDKYYKDSKNINNKKIKKIENKGVTYSFGDVLNLKDSKEKIIFLAKNNDAIYYINFNQLDLFISIESLNKKKVNGLYRKLNDNELNKLVNKLNKPMINDKICYIPENVREKINIHCKKR